MDGNRKFKGDWCEEVKEFFSAAVSQEEKR